MAIESVGEIATKDGAVIASTLGDIAKKFPGIACLWALGLHGLWNAGMVFYDGLILSLVSAVLGVREYRKLLANKGYRP